jgi:integrase
VAYEVAGFLSDGPLPGYAPLCGVHPSTAQKMLGHSDIRMTLAIYTHATDDMQHAAANALESAFG